MADHSVASVEEELDLMFREDAKIKEVCVIGAGYVGGPTAAVMAKYCPDTKFTVVDINKRRIDAWNSTNLPIYEPGLNGLVVAQRDKNLFFSTNVSESIKRAQIIFLAVNTPTKEFGTWVRFATHLMQYKGSGYDLAAYESASLAIAQYAENDVIVVEKSTVPVRTAERIRELFEANKRKSTIKFEVLSNPEFLAEGTAIRDLISPDRILIGGNNTPSGLAAIKTLSTIYERWVPSDKILTSNLWSSELAKLACNAFLSQRVSSVNSLTALCEATGADVEEVAKVIGTDPRIGPQFLKASVGFGGSCFAKDLLGLIYLCETYQLGEVANYWRQVLVMNNYQKQRFSKLIVEKMFGNVKGKNICVFGFAFKKDTGDVRESAAIDVTKFLLEEQANLFVYDPKVPEVEIGKISEKIRVEHDPYTAAFEAHAVVVLTEWDEFKTLDYERIYRNMQKPAFLFDGRLLLNHAELQAIGFKVHAIGKAEPRQPSFKRISEYF